MPRFIKLSEAHILNADAIIEATYKPPLPGRPESEYAIEREETPATLTLRISALDPVEYGYDGDATAAACKSSSVFVRGHDAARVWKALLNLWTVDA